MAVTRKNLTQSIEMKTVGTKPLGRVLERAGLISELQIRQVLEIQAQGNRVKFGAILVSQGILKQKTINFFAEQLPKLLQQPQAQPLGYHLKAAALINSQQINSLLEEQKQTGRLFGELIVEKGWLSKKTLDFFLQHLGRSEKNKQLLLPSYRGIIKSLHLETKAASPYALLKEVFAWTGGHPLLTQQLCKIIADSDAFISEGLEARWIEWLIEERVVHNWETQVLGEFLKTTRDHLLNNEVCSPIILLNLYLKILQHEEFNQNLAQGKQELIRLGLVSEQNNKLEVSNRIYRSIFDRNWVEKQLSALEPKPRKLLRAKKTSKETFAVTKIKNEPLTKIGALTVLLGLLLITPLVIIANNSDSKSDNNIALQPLSSSTLCTEPIPADETTREVWRRTLQQEKQKLAELPNNCQSNLDKLLILYAIQLGKENRVLEGVENLCQIKATSQSFNKAQFWLNRWYSSADWGDSTQSYLRFLDNCPVAEELAAN